MEAIKAGIVEPRLLKWEHACYERKKNNACRIYVSLSTLMHFRELNFWSHIRLATNSIAGKLVSCGEAEVNDLDLISIIDENIF